MAAKELTAEQQEERGAACFELNEQVKAALRDTRTSAWDLAQALAEWDEAAGWTGIGGYENLTDWLADPEIGMTKNVYYRLVRGYRVLARNRLSAAQMQELDPTKVEVVLPSIEKGKTPLEDALQDVKRLGWRDLREKYVKRPTPAPDPVIDGTATEKSDEEQAALDQQYIDKRTAELEGRDEEPQVGAPADLSAWTALRKELLDIAERGKTQDRPRMPNAAVALIAPAVAEIDALISIDAIPLAA